MEEFSDMIPLVISQEEYDWLVSILAEPAKVDPKLAALFAEPTIWNEEI